MNYLAVLQPGIIRMQNLKDRCPVVSVRHTEPTPTSIDQKFDACLALARHEGTGTFGGVDDLLGHFLAGASVFDGAERGGREGE